MKHKIETLRYLLSLILFFAIAYMLCGMLVSLPFRGAVHFQNRFILAVTLIVGICSIWVMCAFIAAILDRFDCLIFDQETVLGTFFYYVFPIAMGVVPFGAEWVLLGLNYHNIFNTDGLVEYTLPFSFFVGSFFAVSFFAVSLSAAILFIAHTEVGKALDYGVIGVKKFCFSVAFAVALSGFPSLVYVDVLLCSVDTGAEVLSLIDLSTVERLNAIAATVGLVVFAILARRGSE